MCLESVRRCDIDTLILLLSYGRRRPKLRVWACVCGARRRVAMARRPSSYQPVGVETATAAVSAAGQRPDHVDVDYWIVVTDGPHNLT